MPESEAAGTQVCQPGEGMREEGAVAVRLRACSALWGLWGQAAATTRVCAVFMEGGSNPEQAGVWQSLWAGHMGRGLCMRVCVPVEVCV